MKKLYIKEIFQSVQGEGFHTGRLAVFVRFAGCNLRCDFCDTKYAWKKEDGKPLTVNQLVAQVRTFSSKFVVLTGGEPLVQDLHALQELVYLLKENGCYVAMESNGVMMLGRYKAPVDWITISPKTAVFNTSGDELKLLYDGTQDLEFYEQFDFRYFYLQPILPERAFALAKSDGAEFDYSTTEQYYEAFQKVLRAIETRAKAGSIWRISFQAQKLVGWI